MDVMPDGPTLVPSSAALLSGPARPPLARRQSPLFCPHAACNLQPTSLASVPLASCTPGARRLQSAGYRYLA